VWSSETGFPLPLNLKGENWFQFIESDGVGKASAVGSEIDKFDRKKGWRVRRFRECNKVYNEPIVSASKYVHRGLTGSLQRRRLLLI
jgi:hypothetical protein